MASAHGFASSLMSLTELGFTLSSSFSIQRSRLIVPKYFRSFSVEYCSRLAITICNHQNPRFVVPKRDRIREFRLFKSVELDQFLTSDDEDEMSEGFFEAIEELERMTREPSDVLEEMNDRLSARELQLVLVYFSQEGRDSWCALEVFEWLRKENRVDKETMELMVSIMCSWVKKLIQGEHCVGDVVDLLVDMDCVGLKPSFSMIEKVISLYWEMEENEKAVLFVKEVLRREIAYAEDDADGHKGGPTGYLAWKMMVKLFLSYNSPFYGKLNGFFILKLNAIDVFHIYYNVEEPNLKFISYYSLVLDVVDLNQGWSYIGLSPLENWEKIVYKGF